jgi:Tfp pilus assembly protein PilN
MSSDVTTPAPSTAPHASNWRRVLADYASLVALVVTVGTAVGILSSQINAVQVTVAVHTNQLATIDKRLDELKQQAKEGGARDQDLSDRMVRMEQALSDRMSRVEGKLDLLLERLPQKP